MQLFTGGRRMNPNDLDKIVDKLLVFRKKVRSMPTHELTWWQKNCLEEMNDQIDKFIKIIDMFGEAMS